MKNLAVVYFTGTGNSLYIAKRICEGLSKEYRAEYFEATQNGDPILQAIQSADLILLAFPIYGSSPPIPMREFLARYGKWFGGKNFAIAETQYFFSGDGAASLGRAVEKLGGKVIAAEHFNMPNNLADSPVFSVKNGGDLDKTLFRAKKRADRFAKNILSGKCARRGFGVFSHAVGYFSQRKFFRKGEAEKRKKLSINRERCVSCGLCAEKCPVQNLKKENGRIVPAGKCVLCYRCVNLCPQKAITLVGKNPPKEQYRGVK